MHKCWWCHKEEKPYAFGLCLSCYRWFLRAIQSPPLRCSVCEKIISKKQETDLLCPNCKKEIEISLFVPKRVTHMEDKYETISKFLNSLTAHNLDPEIQLTAILKFKNRKLAKIVCDRFYGKKTLHEIGQEYKVSREYIRQCEDRAVNLLEKYVNGDIL